MIAYLDASAIVKRYVAESGSRETIALTATSEMIATSIVSRVEVGAAFAKAARAGFLTRGRAQRVQRSFTSDWPDFIRVPVTEALAERAEALAWAQRLRGYDAVQLASAMVWQESLGMQIVLATFDRQLWDAAQRTGVTAWPEQRPG